MSLRSLLRSTDRGAGEIHIGGELVGERVLVPLVADEATQIVDQIKVGVAIATASNGSVRIEEPQTTDDRRYRTISPAAEPEATANLVQWGLDRMAPDQGRVEGILAARSIERRVREHVRHDEVDTLVLPRTSGDGPLGFRRLRRLANRSNCNVVWINGKSGYREFASILLPIAEGPHSGLATDVAGAIAETVDAYVDILHVIPPDPDDETSLAAQERVDTAANRMELGERATPWVLEADDPVATIVEQSNYYGLTVVGAPTAGRLKQFVYGSASRSIRSAAENMVIATRTAGEYR